MFRVALAQHSGIVLGRSKAVLRLRYHIALHQAQYRKTLLQHGILSKQAGVVLRCQGMQMDGKLRVLCDERL